MVVYGESKNTSFFCGEHHLMPFVLAANQLFTAAVFTWRWLSYELPAGREFNSASPLEGTGIFFPVTPGWVGGPEAKKGPGPRVYLFFKYLFYGVFKLYPPKNAKKT
jgi:hypothetical protein